MCYGGSFFIIITCQRFVEINRFNQFRFQTAAYNIEGSINRRKSISVSTVLRYFHNMEDHGR